METQFHESHFLDGETESGDILLLLWGTQGVSNSPAELGFQLRETTERKAFGPQFQNAVDSVLSEASRLASRSS